MTIHIHILEENQHREFLNQRRQDLYSKQELKAGDSIVFCARCRSAFLLDSWRAMGNQHRQCQTEETLAEFPNFKIKFSDPLLQEQLKLVTLQNEQLTQQIQSLRSRNNLLENPIQIHPTGSTRTTEKIQQFIRKITAYLSKQELIETFIFIIGFICALIINSQNKFPLFLFVGSLFLCPIIGFVLSKRFHSNWGFKLFLYYLFFHGGSFVAYYLNYRDLANIILYTNFWSGFLLAINNIIYKLIKP